MSKFKTFITEKVDHMSPLSYGQISSAHTKGIKELKKFGSKPVAIMGGGRHEYIIGNLSDYDKKEYRNMKKPPGTEIYRYATPQSAMTGQIPIVAVNMDKGFLYFMTDESSDGDNPEFGTKVDFRAKYVRPLSELGVKEEVAANATGSVGVSANDVKNIGPKKRPKVLTRRYIEIMGKRKKQMK